MTPIVNSIIFDCETDGLDPSVVHCIATEKGFYRNPGDFQKELDDGLAYCGHNILDYDVPVLTRLTGVDFSGVELFDSLVLSRLAEPSREGGHSLGAWGERLGYPKVEHENWSCYSGAMRYRCEEDVKLNRKVLTEVLKELEGFSEESIQLEHEVAAIIAEQTRNGWLLDERKAFLLLAELKEKKLELQEVVRETFKPCAEFVRQVTPRYTATGALSKVGLKKLGDSWDTVGGSFSLIDWVDFNLGSRQQIGKRLIKAGWVPANFTPTGQPKVDETTLAGVDVPEAKLIADYLTVEKRIGMVQSWLELVGPDGRVHGKVNSNGAVTGRMTHYEPNMAQVTSGSKIYGTEMRSCWIARPGYSIVGCDASGLELRMLAHYMNDDNYTREVVHGDVHAANQKAAGLPTRDLAKTFIYAFLYGAGDAKIGAIVGGSKADGRRLKQEFLRKTPALARLKQRVENAARRGWLKGLDGRRIAVRSQHAALNTLLQGAGAVLMKKALVNLYHEAKRQQLDFYMVGNIHDEVQAEVRNDHCTRFGELAVWAIEKAGQDLGLRCPTTGKYQVGDNWSQTH